MDTVALAEALAAWKSALGDEHVIRDAAVLTQAGTATFATTSHVHAVLRPATREEVQSCVRIANRHRVPLYPYSTGKNWGYGSRAPVADGVLLDLGRLNRIVDFREDLAYVTIEPGVTQRQLFSFLSERGSTLWMDATGASPDCSIIGNTLERGFGHTPMGDHCANACALEVVLPTGACVETGFGRFPDGKAGPLSRWGVGPALDGLFSQSNLGIVTRMTVWLMPAPERFQAFFFMSDEPQALGAIVDALRPLRLDGTLRSVMHIGNDYKVLAAARQFPWEDPTLSLPLGPPEMARLRQRFGIACWSGTGALYGSDAQVRDARRRVREALKGKVGRLQFVDDRSLRLMRRFARPIGWIIRRDLSYTLKVIDPVYNLMKGRPTDHTMSSTYWRKRTPMPPDPDPDRDGCGLLWCSPVVPNTAADLTTVTSLASEVVLAHGFEPQMSISLATERSSICVVTISYDRAEAGEDARALACYTDLAERLLAQGYPPYRLNVASMGLMSGQDEYDALLGALKAAIDPNGILAPGRYERLGSGLELTVGVRPL